MRPADTMSRTASGLTATTSPTRPMSTGSPPTSAVRCSAVNRWASSPERPTAYGPCWLISPTSSRPTCPTRTMRITSIVSGVVTRRPPRNSAGRPSRSSIAVICGPPPCTTTGRMPASRRNTMSCANAPFSCSSTMALPPYLTTTTWPWKRCSHGSASARTAAFSPARASFSSRGVGTVLLDVGVREVGGEDLGGAVAEPELDRDGDVAAGHVGRVPVAHGHPVAAERHAVDRDAQPLRVDLAGGAADRHGDASPVGVAREERGFAQVVLRHRAGDGQRVGLGAGAGDGDRDVLGDALRVGLQLQAQVGAGGVHGGGELRGGRRDPGGAGGQQDRK